MPSADRIKTTTDNKKGCRAALFRFSGNETFRKVTGYRLRGAPLGKVDEFITLSAGAVKAVIASTQTVSLGSLGPASTGAASNMVVSSIFIVCVIGSPCC